MVGPTGSGKSAAAHAFALKTGAEIISVDSMQVYRGMDIGTAKPTATEQSEVRYHLIDITDPEDPFSVAEFQQQGLRLLEAATTDVVIVGGTGLHFRALVDPMVFPSHDPEVRARIDLLSDAEARDRLLSIDAAAAANVDLWNPRRVARALEVSELGEGTPTQRATSPERVALDRYEGRISFTAVGLDPGDGLEARLEERLRAMIKDGLVDEVAGLLPRLGRTAAGAVGYRQLRPFCLGEEPLAMGIEATLKATRKLAKRQRTFFRRDPRIQWLPWDDDASRRAAAVERFFAEEQA